jgi:hypothetical protein
MLALHVIAGGGRGIVFVNNHDSSFVIDMALTDRRLDIPALMINKIAGDSLAGTLYCISIPQYILMCVKAVCGRWRS